MLYSPHGMHSKWFITIHHFNLRVYSHLSIGLKNSLYCNPPTVHMCTYNVTYVHSTHIWIHASQTCTYTHIYIHIYVSMHIHAWMCTIQYYSKPMSHLLPPFLNVHRLHYFQYQGIKLTRFVRLLSQIMPNTF